MSTLWMTTFPSDAGVPFGVVFGGTDVNEDVKDEHKRAVMEEVLHKARFAVAFTDKLKECTEELLVCENKKIYVQPQGIETSVASDFSWNDFVHSTGVHTKQVENLRVFLLVCGLRRVKDPLCLLEAFAEWHSQNPLVVLIIIGPKEFVSMSRKLLDNRGLQERLVRNGKNYITTCHNPMKERITYQKLVETLH